MNGIRALSVLVCGMIGIAACATGTGVETTYAPGEGGAGGFGGAGGESTDDTSSTAEASSSSGAGGTGGDATTSSASSSSSSSSSSSTGGGCDYSAPNTCPASETLSAIDGDKNSDTRIIKGTTSKWFKVLVNEAVSSIISFPKISYTASFASPAGMDFDLFEYDGTTSTPSCSGNPKHASGNPEAVSDSWGDNLNSDDTRWLTLEVRYISGNMCPSDPWTLTVKGNTNP